MVVVVVVRTTGRIGERDLVTPIEQIDTDCVRTAFFSISFTFSLSLSLSLSLVADNALNFSTASHLLSTRPGQSHTRSFSLYSAA